MVTAREQAQEHRIRFRIRGLSAFVRASAEGQKQVLLAPACALGHPLPQAHRGEGRLDHVRRLQVHPVLGRGGEEGEQLRLVTAQLSEPHCVEG